MKIAYDAKRAYHNSSGLGNYSRDLIRMMSAKLPDSQLLLLNPKPSNRNPFSAKNITELRPKSKLFGTFWRQFKAYGVANKHQANIYHGLSNELPNGNDQNLKKIVTIHDVIFLRFPEWYKPLDIKIYKAKTLKACNNADIIVAISEQTKRDLVGFLNVPEEKIRVIYQTCHSSFLKTYSEKELEEIKNKYNLPEKFVLNVGTIEPRKNTKTILEALTKIPELPLVIIGRKTDYFKELDVFAKTNKLENRLLNPKVDSMEDLAKIYQLATMFIYPSKFEGFGIPIIEALFSNTPVITNKTGVFPEAGGPHSHYIDINNTDEMVTAIQSILENPKEVNKTCKESRIFAEKFTEKVLAQQWAELYEEVLQQ